MNWYAYVHDDPVNSFDPYGLEYQTISPGSNGCYDATTYTYNGQTDVTTGPDGNDIISQGRNVDTQPYCLTNQGPWQPGYCASNGSCFQFQSTPTLGQKVAVNFYNPGTKEDGQGCDVSEVIADVWEKTAAKTAKAQLLSNYLNASGAGSSFTAQFAETNGALIAVELVGAASVRAFHGDFSGASDDLLVRSTKYLTGVDGLAEENMGEVAGSNFVDAAENTGSAAKSALSGDDELCHLTCIMHEGWRM